MMWCGSEPTKPTRKKGKLHKKYDVEKCGESGGGGTGMYLGTEGCITVNFSIVLDHGVGQWRSMCGGYVWICQQVELI